jgi:hypothetical protein
MAMRYPIFILLLIASSFTSMAQFGPLQNISLVAKAPRSIEVMNFDDDGVTDILVSNSEIGLVVVYPGIGGGGFRRTTNTGGINRNCQLHRRGS